MRSQRNEPSRIPIQKISKTEEVGMVAMPVKGAEAPLLLSLLLSGSFSAASLLPSSASSLTRSESVHNYQRRNRLDSHELQLPWGKLIIFLALLIMVWKHIEFYVDDFPCVILMAVAKEAEKMIYVRQFIFTLQVDCSCIISITAFNCSIMISTASS